MYYIVDIKKCKQLGLTGANALVYSALCMLSKKQPWKGSARELAEISMCGSRETARRALVELTEKGLINDSAEGWSIVKNQANNAQTDAQNVQKTPQPTAQNVQKTAQNEAKSKDAKERTKEKEEKTNKKNIVGVDNSNTPSANAPINFLDFQNINTNDMTNYSSRKTCYQIIVGEFGFLHPKTILDTFETYYNGHGWPERGDREALLRNWLRRERKSPALGATERKCLSHLMRDINPAIACRFYDVLQGFEINDTNVVFYFGAEHLQKVADWIGSTEIPDIIEQVYHRGTMARERK